MVIEERDDTIDEKPATHRRKAQYVGAGLGFALLAILLISSLMRMGSGTEIRSAPDRIAPTTAMSPEDEAAKLRSRFDRAERSRRERTTPEILQTIADERSKLSAPVAPAVPEDTWAQEELDRVRRARYDDYDLDLGFNQPERPMIDRGAPGTSTRPAKNLTPFNPAAPGGIDGSIASVRKEIQRAQAMREQLLSRGASGLPPAGSRGLPSLSSTGTARSPSAPLVLGHSKSNSVEQLPQEGQKLLPVTSVIRAVLDQTVISDYTGPYRARVLDDVYDVSRRYILIPKGSTIDGRTLRIGNVNEPIQARMALTVNWIVLPNGHKIDFTRQYMLDREGVAAVKDKVNRHFLAQFLGVAAYAVLSSETSRTGTGFNNDSTFESDVGEEARRHFAPLAQKYLRLVPTITLRPGTPLRVYIAEELYITPWDTVGSEYVRY